MLKPKISYQPQVWSIFPPGRFPPFPHQSSLKYPSSLPLLNQFFLSLATEGRVSKMPRALYMPVYQEDLHTGLVWVEVEPLRGGGRQWLV